MPGRCGPRSKPNADASVLMINHACNARIKLQCRPPGFIHQRTSSAVDARPGPELAHLHRTKRFDRARLDIQLLVAVGLQKTLERHPIIRVVRDFAQDECVRSVRLRRDRVVCRSTPTIVREIPFTITDDGRGICTRKTRSSVWPCRPGIQRGCQRKMAGERRQVKGER